MDHREAVHGPHHEEGTDNDHGPVVRHSNDYAGAGNDGDIHHHHDEGCSHGLQVGRDGCYSSHRWMDTLRDDMVVTENDDGVRSEGLRSAPDLNLVGFLIELRRHTNIRRAANVGTLEFLIIQFFNSSF